MTHHWNPDVRLSRRNVIRGAAGFGLVAAAGPLLAGCGSGGGSANAVSAAGAQAAGTQAAGTRAAGTPGNKPALETSSIRMLALPPATCYAAQYLAEPFLREQGFTDVQYKPFPAKEAFAKLAAGEADVGMGYAAAFIPMIDAGAPLVMLGGVHVGCWEIIANRGIKSMRDFKGKTVAIIGPDFIDGRFLGMTLANVGLDMHKDVKLVTHPPTEFARLLSSGEVDAVLAFPPVSTALKAKKIGRVVLSSIADPPWSGYYCCTVAVHRSFMEKNPVATKAALRAVLKGADTVAKDPKGSAHHLVAHGFTPSEEYARTSLKEIPYKIWRDFEPSDSVRFYSLRLKEAGIIRSTPEQIIKRGTNFSYLAELKRELGPAPLGSGSHALHH